MPKFLSVANKLLSLRGAIRITDENDSLAYEAKGEFALFAPTWTFFQGDFQVATVRRRIFAWRQSWEVNGVLGEFLIKRKILSFTRQMYVEGGPYEGATISGNIFDQRFSVAKADGTVLGKAAGKILTFRDRHNVELLSQAADDVTFTVIAMVVLQLARKRDESTEDRD
jgi:uncharacterized protein YxjI